jgi:hypothetical protein
MTAFGLVNAHYAHCFSKKTYKLQKYFSTTSIHFPPTDYIIFAEILSYNSLRAFVRLKLLVNVEICDSCFQKFLIVHFRFFNQEQKTNRDRLLSIG